MENVYCFSRQKIKKTPMGILNSDLSNSILHGFKDVKIDCGIAISWLQNLVKY